MKKLIVFVCTGNTCRSPMAEALFRKKAEDLGLTKLKVCSAGTRAKKGEKMNEKSAQILMDKGFEPLSFSSQPIDKRLLKQSLAVVCMTDAQRDMLMEMRWQVMREAGEEEIENNVYSFSELVGYEVIDPYGKDMDCYRYVFELISGGMSALVEKLLPIKVREKLIEKSKAPTGTKRKTAAKTAKKSGRPSVKTGTKTGVKTGAKTSTKTGAKKPSTTKKKNSAKPLK